ncbi:MAG: glycosyltransferase [Dysgonomonas sp.]
MKVNIILITYNHSAYIRQALNGLIIQMTNHDVEVIVADDASTDNTLDIIREYAEKLVFPFTFLSQEENIGYNKNYERAIKACNGDYIAVLEGDDYWIDPLRIEKHIDFLDKHRNCSMSFNRIVFFFQDQERYKVNDWKSDQDFISYSVHEQIRGNKIGNLSACVFRKSEMDKIKPGLFDMQVADWMLGIVLGQYGSIAELKDPMSVYRIHGKGLWSRQDEREQIQCIIDSISEYNKYLDYAFNEDFIQYKNYLERSLKGKNKKRITHFIKFLIPS